VLNQQSPLVVSYDGLLQNSCVDVNWLTLQAERHLDDLRDTADRDYVLARVAIRYGLDPQFLWLAAQAVEKYLKLLLVFNRRDARHLGHNIQTSFQQVTEISDIPFGFSPIVPDVVKYLEVRADRYAERSYAVSLRRLANVDETVWYLRRFCSNLRGNSDRRLQLTPEQIQAEIDRRADEHFVTWPDHFWFTGGFLDAVRRDRSSPLRQHLVWNNLYFSRRRRIAASQSFDRAANSYLVMYPETVSELGELLKITGRKRKAG
jgi:HEPN domain-containing protein